MRSMAWIGLCMLLSTAKCLAQDAGLYGGGEFDPYAMQDSPSPVSVALTGSTAASSGHPWGFDFLPEGLIYRPYLAGPKESRTGIQFSRWDQGWRFDSSIGGQWGLFRFGSSDRYFPKGWQLDCEASAQLRSRDFASQDLLTTDIRFGLPLSYSRNNHQTKFAIYFLRSNPSRRLLEMIGDIGDGEFFERKAFVLGHSIYLTDRIRVYGEAGYAFETQIADKWEFQFGAESRTGLPNRNPGGTVLGRQCFAARGS